MKDKQRTKTMLPAFFEKKFKVGTKSQILILRISRALHLEWQRKRMEIKNKRESNRKNCLCSTIRRWKILPL